MNAPTFAARRTFAKRLSALAGAGLTALGAIPKAIAQSFPNKPVRLVVGASAGGPSDFLARMFGDSVSPVLGQPFIVDLKPGASGTIAGDILAKSGADGHTLFMSGPAAISVAPHLMPKLTYDPLRDFQPVAMMGAGAFVLVVHPSLPVRNVAELIAYAKANPEKITYGTGGNGSSGHLCTEYFCQRNGLKMLHVPYKGDGQAVTDLVSGQIQLMFTAPNVPVAHVKAGRLRLLAVTTRQRVPSMADTPTVQEATGDFEYLGWIIAFAHSSMPAANVAALANAWDKARTQQPVKGRLEELAMAAPDALIKGPALIQFVKDEYARLGKVIRDANIKPDN